MKVSHHLVFPRIDLISRFTSLSVDLNCSLELNEIIHPCEKGALSMIRPILTIAVPCYNEEAVFKITEAKLSSVMHSLVEEGLIDPRSKLLFIDDGSIDHTWNLIEVASQNNKMVAGLKLARNFGHQKALLAGLSKSVMKSDCVISIDADLQDDIFMIKEFIHKYMEGHDIVYGVRNKRDTDTAFKRMTAQGFYRLMNKMGMNLVYNHADYRLMSQRAIKELLKFKESNLFLRGIVPLIGFKTTEVYYDRKEREAGETKYPLKKMLSFAFEGITSFSVIPIRVITIVGFMAALLSVLAGGYALVQKLLGHTQSGWASLVLSVWFIGGLLLMSIGLIGEYIGKIYEEVKQRPRYIIEMDLYSQKMTDRLSQLNQHHHQTGSDIG